MSDSEASTAARRRQRWGDRRQAEREPSDPAVTSEIAGWGYHPVVRARVRRSENLEHITAGAALSRGLGRSYGDASLPSSRERIIASTTLADRLLGFDREKGLVRVEAGFPLVKLNRLSLPRGWFTPVTPGTHFVTVGGMVAADVHGKNHHVAGCFGEHVTALKLRVAGGSILECSDEVEPDLFRATLGGMGLTGHILEAEFRLQPVPTPWILQESERVADFDAMLEGLEAAGRQWPFTVCWSDFLTSGRKAGRGLLMAGRWAEPDEAPRQKPKWRSAPALPFLLPSWALQNWMLRIGNHINYAWHGSQKRHGIIHPEACFYPLDILREWNRAYGRRGFTQHQAVLPAPHNHPRHRQYLELIQRNRAKIFLCVVKDCGPEGKGTISFPKRGVSYALDIPIDDTTQRLVDKLNDFVAAEGGRIYLAKDAFTRAEHFRAMEPRLGTWLAVRRKWDPELRLVSAQSVRVFGDTP